MQNKRAIGLVLAGAAVMVAAWTCISNSYGSTAYDGQRVIWEYARLRIGNGEIVFAQAEKQYTVKPTNRSLMAVQRDETPAGSLYSVQSVVLQDHAMAALNIFGGEGWEAISVTPTEGGMVVLMKRPR